jgi:two-component system, NtrC family, sensor kinase
VASQWRIRHKLTLGLGLMVANLAILLGGSLWGLISNSATMKSIQGKVEEQSAAETVRQKIASFSNLNSRALFSEQQSELKEKLAATRKSLNDYKSQLEKSNKSQSDVRFEFEMGLVGQLEKGCKELELAMLQADAPTAGNRTPDLFASDSPVWRAIKTLDIASEDLRRQLKDDIQELIKETHRPYRNSLIIVIGTSCLGIGLMAGLSRYFFIWVIHPIRDLHEGAVRLARGDFEHRMSVHSGDEMQELAEAFNNMSDRLRDMYRDLAHQVNERSRQLVRSERLAGVGFLAAGVAHEINNPLASIAFCSEALEGRFARILSRVGSEGETIAKHLRTIQQEAFRCKAITERLLEFSRGGEHHREKANITGIVESVLEMVHHLPNANGKTIDFRPAGTIYAWANGQEIKSVVLNLVVNALDSMDDTGSLKIALSQKGQMAEMVFTDTGCGMDEEVLENLFEPFFTRSRTGKGTGLGLSISHRIITQHGGEVEVSSAGRNKGSTFIVRLPQQAAPSIREDQAAHAAAA